MADPDQAGWPAAAALDARRARRRFGRAAPTYAGAARLEQEVGERMLERLDFVKLAPQLIIDAGSGPAREAPALLRRYPGARLLALDFSLEMLQQARPAGLGARLSRLMGGSHAETVCADLQALPLPAAGTQLLWSNMALHWVREPRLALAEFHRVLAPGGLLMFSTLGPDTLRELRAAFAAVDGQAHVNTFVDMHDLGDQLGAAGFSAPVMDVERITLTYAEPAGLLRDLRASGQASCMAGRPRALYGTARWARMLEALAAHVHDGRIPATAEVIYGHAWREAPRQSADGRSIVKFETAGRRSRL